MARRTYDKRYEHLLPEFYPLKLIGAFISLDFIVGCSFNCSFCISKRHPSREELYEEGLVLDSRVPPKKMLSWLHSLPSFRAGVQVRIGHDTDAGLEFEKSARLIDLIEEDRSVVYLTRKPFTEPEVKYFTPYRPNLLLKLTATPRSASLGVKRNPLNLVRSAEPLDPRMLYWVVGPLVRDSQEDTEEVLRALPKGSTLFLKRLNTTGLPHLDPVPQMEDREYARLEELALSRGLLVTEWFCKSGLSRIRKGFFDVDKITGQPASPKRERELGYCTDCASNAICHGELDRASFEKQLRTHLYFLGLTLAGDPVRTGNRSFTVTVQEPSSRGEETYLNHAIHPPVSITLSTREKGRSQGGSFGNVDRLALKRWYENGFLPVTELNTVAGNVLRDIRRLFCRNGHETEHLAENAAGGDGGICG